MWEGEQSFTGALQNDVLHKDDMSGSWMKNTFNTSMK